MGGFVHGKFQKKVYMDYIEGLHVMVDGRILCVVFRFVVFIDGDVGMLIVDIVL